VWAYCWQLWFVVLLNKEYEEDDEGNDDDENGMDYKRRANLTSNW